MAAHSAAVSASSWASRVVVTSTNSARTAGPGAARRTATKGSLVAAKSFFTWSPRGSLHSGTGSPMIARSIPMRWESWSLTSQPGHSVGKAHSVSESSQQTSASAPQVSASAFLARRPCRSQSPS